MNTRRFRSHWELRFFGLTPTDKDVFLHPIFTLMYYVGFTFDEAYRLPIWQRRWFIERTSEEFKRSADKGDGSSRAAHANSEDQRAMLGRARSNPPARLRRFS